ncbi:multidrug transporter [Neobacillus sp. MER 74]|uniref:multidrug transporter n=1 Tax=Neobacillus sp. MER 74 TaxID=2939566 RepID=UPI00203D2597|nr:multidrug transporter [Neobacillus sp. MER 74]MCM3114597.1 multidrug transporter [Neobacillus sp. MER 74]
MLRVNGDFGTLLIGVEGTKTPAGVRDRGDPAGAKRRGGSPAPPAESEVPGTEINRPVNTALHLNRSR